MSTTASGLPASCGGGRNVRLVLNRGARDTCVGCSGQDAPAGAAGPNQALLPGMGAESGPAGYSDIGYSYTRVGAQGDVHHAALQCTAMRCASLRCEHAVAVRLDVPAASLDPSMSMPSLAGLLPPFAVAAGDTAAHARSMVSQQLWTSTCCRTHEG